MNAPLDATSAPSGPRLAAHLALVAVHVAVALGFSRVYDHWSFAGPLLAFVLGAHVLAAVARARRVPAPVVAVVAVIGGTLVATWTVFPATARYGLPTGQTWSAARDALSMARAQFSKVVAPAPPLPGFQLSAGLALWGSVWFADWTAFRLRTTVEAVAPATVVFVFASLFGTGHHRVSSVVTFTAAVLLFVAAHRAMRAQLDQAWATASPAAGSRAMLRAGAVVAVVAVAGGAAFGPRLPGAEADALVDWRSNGPGGTSRVTISPMVDLRTRLVDQSDTEVFTVRASRSAYWRLTSLDRFDGQIWSSSGQYGPAGTTALPSQSASDQRSRSITQRVQIEALSAIWVPSAYEARRVPRSSEQLRWDRSSSTLIVDASEPSSDGLTYTVESELPELSRLALASSPELVPDEITPRYTSLPADFPAVARAAAQQVTGQAANRYEAALALQDWFRTGFTYDLSIGAGHGDDALVAFLQNRRGYCEQFAGAYAAMARSLGMPARVAVGFTPGDRDPQDLDTFHVRGRHAHAWPEVWFASVGWVPFEPTPGRGMPDGEEITGVPPQQDDSQAAVDPGTTATTAVGSGASDTSTSAPPATPATTAPPPTRTLTTPGAPPNRGGLPGWVVALGGVVVLALAWLAALLAAPWIRRRVGRRARLAHPVLGSWADALGPVRWATGLAPFPAETHQEFAGRAARHLGPVGRSLRELAEVVTLTVWSPTGHGATPARRAAELSAVIGTELDDRVPWPRRLWRRISWREAFGRSPKPG